MYRTTTPWTGSNDVIQWSIDWSIDRSSSICLVYVNPVPVHLVFNPQDELLQHLLVICLNDWSLFVCSFARLLVCSLAAQHVVIFYCCCCFMNFWCRVWKTCFQKLWVKSIWLYDCSPYPCIFVHAILCKTNLHTRVMCLVFIISSISLRHQNDINGLKLNL